MKKEMELNEIQLDALKEVANIGAGHAATALSHLVDRKILITVPKLDFVRIEEIPTITGNPEDLTAVIYTHIIGDITGGIFFILPRDSALLMIDLLKGYNFGITKIISGLDEEMLKQAGGLLAKAYLSALARFAKLTLVSSSESFAFDMVGAVIDSIIADIDLRAQHAILAETEFVEAENKVSGQLFFVPDFRSLEVIMDKLGVK
ncbi:MAG: chemotaxis protein CheC [Actinobacteria bacterium]|nr:chemotaxis protein CheC [Actinomycetota bacterium]